MKTKLRIVLASVLVAAGLAVTAGAASYDNCADQLKDLGLFQGTEDGYELDRAPTRGEAATMLVRLLGKEAEAKELTYEAPFTDLDDWQKPYVQYLYDNKLTNGATETTFEPEEACSAQMYTTFLLRALGYSDAAEGDFTYDAAIDFGETIGLVDYANCNESAFLRDHVAAMSLTALNTDVKGETETKLLEKLVADGAVDEAKAESLLAFFDNYDAYVEATAAMGDATKMDVSADVSASVALGDQQVMSLSMPMEIKADMDMESLDQSKMAVTGTIEVTIDESLVEEGADTSFEMPMEYYYTDGVYYMNMGDQKVKMEMSMEDAMSQMGDLTDLQNSEPICLIESITKSGSTMTVTYSSAGMSGLVNSVLDSMNIDTAAEGVAIDIGEVISKATVSNGKISGMDMNMKMTMTVEGQTMTMDMNMKCDINSIGNVTITLPSDLDSYTDLIGGADEAAA
ncbi:S-layer homology domain-containing protein [Agathobaculum sp. NSJ-28]|uniref:S-layer homology domain-containing protein n=2 Tax=Agathobaculum TaxID=2048137 RepID=A0A923LRP0_9FIRM|nr:MULTISPECIES: S-layer homology domain-containing protein [Agathobaculum]MBC5724025.1 S-layer homology domain-containing protein [Agathobaculum faecis]MBS6882115.1 S-layer homology domain-containing protein [Clostridiaceae bacterium]MCU6787658.1 S-layer homology domain-containing protein [Agathobaculum ammoniilyticum]SCI41764.1 Hexagonal wall protein [uncultured Butyricicoccus sp.]